MEKAYMIGLCDHGKGAICSFPIKSFWKEQRNVPLDEAEELVEKVREKKMGELFENMEHMDIQAERRNTAEQRERADKAEKQTKIERERGIKIFIDTCREFGLSQEDVVNKLAEKYEMNRELAEEWVQKVIKAGNE